MKTLPSIIQVINIPSEEINLNTSPYDIEKWDSFQYMNLTFALEEHNRIKFTDEEIVNIGNKAR